MPEAVSTHSSLHTGGQGRRFNGKHAIHVSNCVPYRCRPGHGGFLPESTGAVERDRSLPFPG